MRIASRYYSEGCKSVTYTLRVCLARYDCPAMPPNRLVGIILFCLRRVTGHGQWRAQDLGQGGGQQFFLPVKTGFVVAAFYVYFTFICVKRTYILYIFFFSIGGADSSVSSRQPGHRPSEAPWPPVVSPQRGHTEVQPPWSGSTRPQR